nr:MAG TPA: Rtr1/RPAP2 family [Caudoviricetes sp.]
MPSPYPKVTITSRCGNPECNRSPSACKGRK